MLPQGGDLDGKNVQPVVEVLAKASGLHFFPQLTISSGDDAHIGAARAVFAHAFVTFFLQGAQQFALQVQRHFADFIQKQGAALGHLESTGRDLLWRR